MPSYASQEYKRLFTIGVLTYSAFLLLSIWYYQERTLFSDIAYHLFYILKSGDYAIQNERFGAAITQSIPVLGSALGLSLKKIAFLYSIGFVLYYFAIFLLLWKWLNNQALALVLLLFSTLMVGGTFFWIQSEFPQGLAFMLLTFGIVTHHERLQDYNKLELLLLPPMLVTVAYFHPLIFIPFTYCCAFFGLSQKTWPVNKRLLGFSFGLFWLVYILKKTLLAADSDYEQTAMSGLGNIWSLFPNYFFTAGNANFLLYIATTALVGLFFGLLYYYKQQKRWYALFLLLSFFVGYLLLVSISFNHARFNQHYMENLYLPLAIIVGLPFVVDGLPALKDSWRLPLFAFIVLACLGRIIAHSFPFTERLNWQKEFLHRTAELGNKKLLVDSKQVPQEKLMHIYWSTPYEFWLLSSIQTGSSADTRSIVIHDNPQSLEYIKNSPDYFLTYWGNFNYKELPLPYFKLNDASPYIYYNPQSQ
jgi:hypothetical protein